MWITLISSAIPFLKKYWELLIVVFLVIAFGIYIMNIKRDINKKQTQIEELHAQVIELEVSNKVLVKNLAFFSEKLRIAEVYSNSALKLQSISNYTLSQDILEFADDVISEYLILFPNLRITNDSVVGELE